MADQQQLRSHKIQTYGWIPDLPDARDHLYAAPPPVLVTLPPKKDLRPQCPLIYVQGQLGSCTGNSIAAAIQFERMKQGIAGAADPDFVPSRMFIYYNERVMDGTISEDSGAQIRDGIKSVATLGVCFEGGANQWAYDPITKFADKPPEACYETALKDKVVQYSRLVPVLGQLKGCLASGFPFVFGFTVYESFESPSVANSGVVPMPAANEHTLGGHAVMAVGYDDATSSFIIRNSWGKDWGKDGYCTMPYNYLTESNLSDDFWTIRLVQPPVMLTAMASGEGSGTTTI